MTEKLLSLHQEIEKEKKEDFNYLTKNETKYDEDFNNASLLQITLGLQSCKTKNDVIELLKDAQQIGFNRALVLAQEKLEKNKNEAIARMLEVLEMERSGDYTEKRIVDEIIWNLNEVLTRK